MLANECVAERFELRPDVVATVLEDGAVLLDLETKYFYRLNRSGWAIAQLFETGATVADALEHSHACGASAKDDAAITSFIDALSRDRLIETAEDGPGAAICASETAGTWSPPTIERQAEPLQRVIISAFDPSVPLVE
jgi:coenzyme PQQ synthesis protein D (PqqD)